MPPGCRVRQRAPGIVRPALISILEVKGERSAAAAAVALSSLRSAECAEESLAKIIGANFLPLTGCLFTARLAV